MIEVRVTLPLARFALDVDLRLGGGVTALMGSSGSGKTSLLESVAGLRRRAQGRIAFAGEAWLDSDRAVRLPPEKRRVGYVPQDAGLFPHLTARENVRFGARAAQDAVATAIDTLGIGPLQHRYPHSLSGGEKQRVALARALATRPRLLLLDEPLAALDSALRERVLPYLIRIRDEWQTPCLYVTHNVGEALAVAEHLVVLEAGRVAAHGRPESLLSAPSVVRESAGSLENIFQGAIEAQDEAGGVTRLVLDSGLALAVPLVHGRVAGERVTAAFRAEDVLLLGGPPGGISARNLFAATVVDTVRSGADVTVRCRLDDDPRGAGWLARITPAAEAAMNLVPGCPVHVAVKSHSIRLL